MATEVQKTPNVLAVEAAVEAASVEEFEKFKFIDSLRPFNHPQSNNFPLELLSLDNTHTENPAEVEVLVAFQNHLAALRPELAENNIKEVKKALADLAIAGKEIAGVELTVQDLKQLDNIKLTGLGLNERQINILRRLFH